MERLASAPGGPSCLPGGSLGSSSPRRRSPEPTTRQIPVGCADFLGGPTLRTGATLRGIPESRSLSAFERQDTSEIVECSEEKSPCDPRGTSMRVVGGSAKGKSLA